VKPTTSNYGVFHPQCRAEDALNRRSLIVNHRPFAITLAIIAHVALLPVDVGAQPAPVPTQRQSDATQNLQDFDFVVAKITANYAGYETKTTGDEMARLTALTADLRNQARLASSPTALLAAMTQYIAFFKDKHTTVSVISSNDTSPSNTGPFAARVGVTEASARRQLAALGNRRAPIEGIWSIDGSRYKMAVLRDDQNAQAFSAIILNSTNEDWKPGMIKASIARTATGALAMTYRTGDFTEVLITPSLAANGAMLDVGDYGGWRNEWPNATSSESLDKMFPSSEFFVRRLSAKTLWIRLPNFRDENASVVAQLLKDNQGALETTDNLIIDTRRNGGGSDFVYDPLIPLIYTRPIYSVGIEMRASVDNIALRQTIAEELAKVPEAKDTVAQLQRQNILMGANIGRYVQPNSAPFSIQRMTNVRLFPKRVAVLIDRAGSTGEQFLLDARQSHKVTLFGQENSAGVLDFANVVSMKSPSGRFEVQWPTSRSLRLPDDPVDIGGIAPDIRIPASVTDSVTFTQNWLERQVD
jgi:hypothetical protein